MNKRAMSSLGGGTGGIGSFFQRVSSFIVGAGVSALVSQYYIYNELISGNESIIQKQNDLEKRLKALENEK